MPETQDLVEIIACKRVTDWALVYDAARATQAKIAISKEPADEWKEKIMRAPHSPIRCLQYFIQFRCPYFVHVHLVRHHEGVQWFIGSQRNDRQDKYDRRSARQDTPVLVSMLVNADALKFISRRRLCAKADPDTRRVWTAIVEAVGKIDPIVAKYCQPECWWQNGVCDELQSCNIPRKRTV